MIAESPTRTHPDRKSHFRGGIRVQEEGCRGQNGCQGRRLAFRRELQRGRLRTAASSSFEMPRKDDGKANWMSYYYIRVPSNFSDFEITIHIFIFKFEH